MKWPPCRFRIWRAAAFGRVAVDVDHDDRSAVAQRALVRGEIDQLIHQREVEGAPKPPQPARDLAGPVDTVGALLAAEHLQVARGDPARGQLRHRGGGVGSGHR